MPVGRPSDYTAETADRICERMVEGESLISICRDDDMPSRTSVFRWLQSNEEFRDKYARADEFRGEMLAHEILQISDDGTNDWMERRSEAEKGAGVDSGWVLNGEHVQRSKLRIDTRKWYASKVAAKKYGDKITAEHTGANGGAIQEVVRWATSEAEGTNDPSGED